MAEGIRGRFISASPLSSLQGAKSIVVVVRPVVVVPLTPTHLRTDFACRELGRVDVPVSSVRLQRSDESVEAPNRQALCVRIFPYRIHTEALPSHPGIFFRFLVV
jgi:hypothetical protein